MYLKTICITMFVAFLAAQSVAADDAKTEKKQAGEKAKINWVQYDEGLTLAKKEGKPILVDFTTSWCGWCKLMEKEAFADSTIIDMLNNKFISVRVDGDSKEQLNIDGYIITEKALTSQEFGVRGYPTFWFLESDGSRISPMRGYQKIAPFMKALTFIIDRKYEKKNETKSQKGISGGK